MRLHIIDVESIYRRLLATSNAEERESIYRQELLAPFEGMMRFFGSDPLALAKIWTLYTPEEFANETRPAIEAMVDQMAVANAWHRCATALQRGVAAFAPYADHIPLDTINCALVLLDARRANPIDRGYAGFGGIPGYVMVTYSQANDYTLSRVEGASVHELNHTVRFKVVPFIPTHVTVADYIIAEGLAESFAAELYGEGVVGYYVTDFSEDELATAKQVIGDALDVSGFDAVRGYIFGDALADHMGLPKAGVPNFAGYVMGYRAVRQYLQRTGKSVAEATFLPSREIIAESGFF
ncbi:MAG TPA: DUF2268 domain-containing putative Zn-dependent protease [Ktedonobacteraceae bacterium]|nr:DUF2268 domain-containing putative Zn-dependent protease [Ktedonobacteraceae bacterium]